jgi:hypothetical protein
MRDAQKNTAESYAREMKRRDQRIEELEEELRMMRKLLLKSVGEKLSITDRMKRR